MPPSAPCTPCWTPSEPFLPAPTKPAGVLSGARVQSDEAAAARYFLKFSVVPESSDRKNTLMPSDGRFTPELAALMAASSHLVILPVKILAINEGVRVRLVTPLTLYAT